MNYSFEMKSEVVFFCLPTVTKPFFEKTTTPAWFIGAFVISLYIKSEEGSVYFSKGMNILSFFYVSDSKKATYSVALFKG